MQYHPHERWGSAVMGLRMILLLEEEKGLFVSIGGDYLIWVFFLSLY